MESIWNVIRHRYLGVTATVAMLLLLPVIVFSTQRPQNLSGIAEGATTIIFSPTSIEDVPLEKNLNEEFFLNVLVDPGNSVISIVKLDINYDPRFLKLSPQKPILVNESIFTKVVEGPYYSEGKIQITLSVGDELTNALKNKTRAVTINFTPTTKTSSVSTVVSFGSETSASTVEVNDLEEENVVSTTAPAYINVN